MVKSGSNHSRDADTWSGLTSSATRVTDQEIKSKIQGSSNDDSTDSSDTEPDEYFQLEHPETFDVEEHIYADPRQFHHSQTQHFRLT